MKTLYLCGASNPEGVRLAQVVQRSAGRAGRILLLDDDAAKYGRRILDVEVVGSFAALAGLDPRACEVVNLVARTTRGRAAARARIAAHGLPFASLVDPGVDTSGVELCPEITVYEHATVCPGAVVGPGSVVFMGAVVGHGSRIGSGCVIGPGAVLNARVELAAGVYVGSNATILPDLHVGAWATVGAGSVVLQHVPPGATVFGVPASVVSAGESETDSHLVGRAAVEGPATARSAAELELRIAAVWRDVLGRADVDPDVNFFDLGANSLRALQACVRLQETISRDLVITDLFRFPTVRALAQHMSRGLGAAAEPLQRSAEDRGALRRSLLSRRHSGV